MTSDALTALADAFWTQHQEADPVSAHLDGDHRFAGAYADLSRAAEDARIAVLRDIAAKAEALDPADLDAQERITRAVLLDRCTSTADVLETRLAELAADPIFGIQVIVPLTAGMVSLPTADVAWAMADRLSGIAQAFRDSADRLREGREAGRTPAAFAVRGVIAQVDAQLAAEPADHPAITRLPAPPAEVDGDAWRTRLAEVVAAEVRPAQQAYRDCLEHEILPVARPDDRIGLGALADGKAAYAAALRDATTTDRTAQEIHDLGLEQIAKLAVEYRALGPEVVGTDDLAAIFDALRDDPALHFDDADDIIAASVEAMGRAWAAMPAWFATMPQARCSVEGTPSGPLAFYFPPSDDGRDGTFYVNTSDPSAWGTFQIEAIAFHEGIPGHHLQLAVASELDGLPTMRRRLSINAYAEGWGLYTERLADEMGLYSSPLARVGMLAADSMRACRLVVDTGIHALGWSREQAVQYMLDNSPVGEALVRNEIDRYASWPGQACGYMVGRLEIDRIRAEAQQRQGDGFDIKTFHAAVLDSGSLPLTVLDEVVRTRLH